MKDSGFPCIAARELHVWKRRLELVLSVKTERSMRLRKVALGGLLAGAAGAVMMIGSAAEAQAEPVAPAATQLAPEAQLEQDLAELNTALAELNQAWQQLINPGAVVAEPAVEDQAVADEAEVEYAGTGSGLPSSGPILSTPTDAEGRVVVEPGTPIVLSSGEVCTLGVTGYDEAGRIVGFTASHCGRQGDLVAPEYQLDKGAVGVVRSSIGYLDYAVVEFDPSRASVSRGAGPSTVNAVGGQVGATFSEVCKNGRTTGFGCGPTMALHYAEIIAQVCAAPGDSGAPLLVGDRMVGMVTGATGPVACQNQLQWPFFSPTVSTSMAVVLADLNSRQGVGAGFHLPE